MDKPLRETPANSASHANFSFGEIMAKGENAVHSAVTTVKEHPYMSALVVAETAVFVAAAVLTHGRSVRDSERLATLAEVHIKSGRYADLQNYSRAYTHKLNTDLIKATIIGPGSLIAVGQFPVASYMNDLSPVRFFTSDNQCSRNSSDKTDCGAEEKAALRVHEAEAMRFATNEKCEERTGFVCNKEESSFRPQMSGFVSADSKPRAAFPVYTDKDAQGYYSMNGVPLGVSSGEMRLPNEQISDLGRSSVACEYRKNDHPNGLVKDHCQI